MFNLREYELPEVQYHLSDDELATELYDLNVNRPFPNDRTADMVTTLASDLYGYLISRLWLGE